jgi:hypothetical protein
MEDEMGRPRLMHGKEENTYKTNMKTWRARNHSEYLGTYERIVFEDDVILKTTAVFCVHLDPIQPLCVLTNPHTWNITL